MGNYQAVLVQVQIKKLRQMKRKRLPVSNMQKAKLTSVAYISMAIQGLSPKSIWPLNII